MDFNEKLLVLCKERGISRSRVAEDIGLSRAAVTRWERGGVPYASTVKKIADYYAV